MVHNEFENDLSTQEALSSRNELEVYNRVDTEFTVVRTDTKADSLPKFISNRFPKPIPHGTPLVKTKMSLSCSKSIGAFKAR